MSGMETTLVGKACAYLDERRGERVTLDELSRAVGLSPFHLQRLFKRKIGISPKDYQREQRLEETKRLLAEGAGVTDAVFGAGYGSVSRFYEKASSRLGMAARDYRAKGKGQSIAFCCFPTPLGSVLVAATPRGVCSIKLGDDPAQLRRLLDEEFSEAELIEEPAALKPFRDEILSFLAGDQSLADVPLDVRGTVFQRKVWEQLRRIPAGETRTYQEIARAIGAPAAVRAVGSACGANPVALLVPCHRAVRTDGGLGGYAWGVARKKRLLALERRKGKKQ
jgi:AraC family transcriptional regulator, regulatory protein of adaptative response / methylated-DNA-[protein]-cysteine methyltransferase